jgi:hypothetical protein
LVKQRVRGKPKRRGQGATNQREAGKEVAKMSQVIQVDEGKIQAHLWVKWYVGDELRASIRTNMLRDSPVQLRVHVGVFGEPRGEKTGGDTK